MTSLIVNLLIGSFTLLFAAMTLFPLFVSDRQPQTRTTPEQEDRILSIRPVAMPTRTFPEPQPLMPAPSMTTRDRDEDHDLPHAA